MNDIATLRAITSIRRCHERRAEGWAQRGTAGSLLSLLEDARRRKPDPMEGDGYMTGNNVVQFPHQVNPRALAEFEARARQYIMDGATSAIDATTQSGICPMLAQ